MTSITETTTTTQKGASCFRDEGLSAKRLCKQVNEKIAADVMQLLITPDTMGVGLRGRGARAASRAAPPFVGTDNLQIAFRLQEFDQNSEGYDKCEKCKSHLDFVVDACDAVPFRVSEFPPIDPKGPVGTFLQLLTDQLQPSIVRCTKSFPVACCCGSGCGGGGGGDKSNGVDYVEYGITVCYQLIEFDRLGGSSFFLYYATEVQRLSPPHYRQIDGKNCASTPGLQSWSRSGLIELFDAEVLTPSTPTPAEEEEDCPKPEYDWHVPSCKKKCDHKKDCYDCKPKKIDPCDCPFPERKITWKPLMRFRFRTDEPAWVCGVQCQCPMEKSGNNTDCKKRCCSCKYVCLSASGQFASSNVDSVIV